MTIKLIATDIDGTFLDDDSQYNHTYFQELMTKMTAQNIRFVVASGNQYPHLPQYFEDIDGEITYLAENGAHIVRDGQAISEDLIPQALVREALLWMAQNDGFKNAWLILSGQQASYTEIPASAKRFKQSGYFYGDLTSVMDLLEVTDRIYKLDLTWRQFDVSQQETDFNAAFQGRLRATSSGLGGIDIILPHVNKAYGLRKLQSLWGISKAETLAFGDSGNDVEMLQMAKYGYVMKNAPLAVQRQVGLVTDRDNNHDGMLQTVAKYLEEQ